MRLCQTIQVNADYTRAINLERDFQSTQSRPYILTSRAVHVLDRFASTMHGREAPRSWALVGPYGAGKSAFTLFLANVVGNPANPSTQRARNSLAEQNIELAKKVAEQVGEGPGLCLVALTGSPEPFAERLVQALLKGAMSFFHGRPGRQPKILSELSAATIIECSNSEVVRLTSELQAAVARAGGRGVLLAVDELGKFLEYQSRHRGTGDIFLLQSLAEHGMKASVAPLYIFVLLHLPKQFTGSAYRAVNQRAPLLSLVATRGAAIPLARS